MEMVVPSTHEVLENGEMMNLDGGWSLNYNWWGTTLYLTKDECRSLTYGHSIGTAVAGLTNPALAASLAAANVVAQYGADHNGVWLHRTWNGVTWPTF